MSFSKQKSNYNNEVHRIYLAAIIKVTVVILSPESNHTDDGVNDLANATNSPIFRVSTYTRPDTSCVCDFDFELENAILTFAGNISYYIS